MPEVIIVGAGVIGLSVALTLFERVKDVRITILAELTPEDPLNIRYASQWAGAHQVCTMAGSVPDPKQLQFEKDTFRHTLEKTMRDSSVPITLTNHFIFFEEEQPKTNAAHEMRSWMPRWQHFVDTSRLPEGCVEGMNYKSFSYDTPNYLLWLWNNFKAKGGKFHRKTLSHLDEALESDQRPPDVLVNCSGLGAHGLVSDKAMFPTRGQTVRVWAPWVKQDMTRKVSDESSWYIIPRGPGEVILGGTREAGDAWPYPRPETSEAIRQNCVKLCPELVPPEKRKNGSWKDLIIVSENVGLRPSRQGGVRIEKDSLEGGAKSLIPVVHCYGHGGSGFQSSWASAVEAVDLVQSSLRPGKL